MGLVYFSIMLTDRERTATKDVLCVVPKTPVSKIVLMVRRTRPERKKYFAPFVKTKAFFLLRMRYALFPWWISGSFLQILRFSFYLFFLFLILIFYYLFIIPNKVLENRNNIFHHYSSSTFLGEKRLIKKIFLIIVIFLDNKYIKTLLYSNKIVSEIF